MILAVVWCLGVPSPLVGERYTLDAPALEALPSAWSSHTVLEMYMMPATLSNIESMGLSKPDLPKLSIYGDSNTQTRYWLSGIDISDPLHAGAPALRVPFLAMGELGLVFSESPNALASGVDVTLLSHDVPKLRVSGRGVLPHMGGISPGAIELMDKLAFSHPLLVEPRPPSDRRGFDGDVTLSLVGQERGWLYALELNQGQRRFQRYSGANYIGPYSEAYLTSSAVAAHRRLGLTVALDYGYRQRMNAEHFFAFEETFARHALAAFAGWTSTFARAGLTAKLEHDDARGAGFTRELRDPDGQALFPFTPRGTKLGVNFDATFDAPLSGVTRAFVHLGERAVLWLPSLGAWSNPLVLDGASQGRIDFRSLATAYAYGELQAGLRDNRVLGNFSIGYAAYAAHTHALSVVGPGLTTQFDLGLKAHAQWRRTRWFMPYLAIARTPVPFTQNVAELLDPNVLRGQVYSANGELYDTFGDTLSVARGLATVKTHAFSFGFETQFSPQWRFYGLGIAKTFDDTLWLRFAGGDATYRVGSHAFLRPGEKRYELGNFPFSETPFYLGAHIQLVGSDPRRYFFMLGASGYFSIGTTAFGFGPLANDVGIVDTSQASPNARRFPVGNLEGDRAYYVKTGFGVRLVHTLWASLGVRYRDGRPITYYDWRSDNGQAQATYVEPKGSLYRLDGPREGARVNIDAKVTYTIPLPRAALRLAFLISNIYDLAAPIAERQLPGGEGIRATLELEPARAGMITAELLFGD